MGTLGLEFLFCDGGLIGWVLCLLFVWGVVVIRFCWGFVILICVLIWCFVG